MKFHTLIAIVMLLLPLSALAEDSEPSAAEAKTTAEDILDAYHQAVYDKLSPKFSESSHQDIQKMAAQLAREHLLPHKELLHRHAAQTLEKLPKLDAKRLDGMRPVFDADKQKQLEAAMGLFFGSSPVANKEATEELAGMLMAASQWNPAKAAKTIRSASMARTLGSAEYGKRAMLEALAPTKIAALDKNPEKPAIAFIAGPEIFIVWLEYSKKDGYYKPLKAKWLTKAAKEQ